MLIARAITEECLHPLRKGHYSLCKEKSGLNDFFGVIGRGRTHMKSRADTVYLNFQTGTKGSRKMFGLHNKGSLPA